MNTEMTIPNLDRAIGVITLTAGDGVSNYKKITPSLSVESIQRPSNNEIIYYLFYDGSLIDAFIGYQVKFTIKKQSDSTIVSWEKTGDPGIYQSKTFSFGIDVNTSFEKCTGSMSFKLKPGTSNVYTVEFYSNTTPSFYTAFVSGYAHKNAEDIKTEAIKEVKNTFKELKKLFETLN
ncbi:hypothetical protein K1X76_02935 [bacterium]|nr:hypothetical protein [bacterium]